MSETIKTQDNIKKELLDISNSINGIIESYKQLHYPLVESKQDVPRATKQLDKIAEQTEAATHKMLDTVEVLTQREEEIVSGLDEIKTIMQAEKNTTVITLIEKLKSKAHENSNDVFKIMDVLQFQDITAQQINHAVVLLEDLEGKLNSILSFLNGEENTISRNSQSKKKDRAFDPNADFFKNKTEQHDIDSMFSKK